MASTSRVFRKETVASVFHISTMQILTKNQKEPANELASQCNQNIIYRAAITYNKCLSVEDWKKAIDLCSSPNHLPRTYSHDCTGTRSEYILHKFGYGWGRYQMGTT